MSYNSNKLNSDNRKQFLIRKKKLNQHVWKSKVLLNKASFPETPVAFLPRLPSIGQRHQLFLIPSISIAIMTVRKSDKIDRGRSVLTVSLSLSLSLFRSLSLFSVILVYAFCVTVDHMSIKDSHSDVTFLFFFLSTQLGKS